MVLIVNPNIADMFRAKRNSNINNYSTNINNYSTNINNYSLQYTIVNEMIHI